MSQLGGADQIHCSASVPSLARCEIAAFRYRVLHVAAQLTRSARQVRLKIDRTWRWAAQIDAGFRRLRAAFAWPHAACRASTSLPGASMPASSDPARPEHHPGPAAGGTWRIPAHCYQPSTNPRSKKAPGWRLTSRVKEGG